MMIIMIIMTLLMSEHSLRGRPEAAGGGQPQAAAGQHGCDPAQPRGDGCQVRPPLNVFRLKMERGKTVMMFTLFLGT